MAEKKFQKDFRDKEQGANDAYFGGGPSAPGGSAAYKEGFSTGNALLRKQKRMPDKNYVPFAARKRSNKGE